MRIKIHSGVEMSRTQLSARKRPVNLTLNASLVEQAKTYSENLSATVETLLTQFIVAQQNAKRSRQQEAQACSAQWNAFNGAVGSFADEHTTL
jgi:post-segregation antitoxin (ccd killing protein)